MSHALFGERFYSLREVAWHKLGHVFPEPLTARAALDVMGGYDVALVPLVLGDTHEATGRHCIVRAATTDDPKRIIFGEVSAADYTLLSPADLCDTWDAVVQTPLETMGVLEEGRTLFFSTKRPPRDINGDEVEMYTLLTNHYTGKDALQIRTTPVRVVCMNTLIAARSAAVETHNIVHNALLKRELAEWFQTIHDSEEQREQTLVDAFGLMADTPIDDMVARAFFQQVYAEPSIPSRKGPKEYVERQERSYKYAVDRVNKLRDGAASLFMGAGRGSDTRAFKGTMWGAWQSVCECEDCRRPAQGEESFALEGSLWGERADNKERGYGIAVEMSTALHNGRG